MLTRKTFRCRTWNLGIALDWSPSGDGEGLIGVTVASEPTVHRWLVLGQPMSTSWSRRTEDLTFDTKDEKDTVLITRLAAHLRCYFHEPVDETWDGCGICGSAARQLIVEQVNLVQQMRVLLECR